MLSAVIPSTHSYPAVPLARQQVHQWCVHPGPLVLGTGPFNSPTPTEDRDQTVSRRFKPSSRTTLNGEQPYPWDLLQPQVFAPPAWGICHPHGRFRIFGMLRPACAGHLLHSRGDYQQSPRTTRRCIPHGITGISSSTSPHTHCGIPERDRCPPLHAPAR